MGNAASGRNLDILELARLTVPIRINQGGHGSTDAKQGLTNLIVNANGVPFKDTDYSGTLKQDTLTANRTWTLPDATGTVALTSDVDAVSADVTAIGNTWTTYTPTVGSTSGTLTSASATGRYNKIGKIVFVQIQIVITTNGTGAGLITVALPFTNKNAINIFNGRDSGGHTNVAYVIADSATLNVAKYDGTYPGATGAAIDVCGFFETA